MYLSDARLKLTRIALASSFSAAAIGCPSATTAPLGIEKVTVDGSPAANEFDLIIEGRGFGLSRIQYDLDEASGQATETAYRVRVYDELGNTEALAEGALVEVVSPVKVTAKIVRQEGLQPGAYGVAILVGDDEVYAKDRAFEVLGIGRFDGGPGGGRRDGGGGGGGGDGGRGGGGRDGGGGGGGDGALASDVGGNVAPDAGVAPADTGVDPIDAGPPDTGIPPDSGLGPWIGDFQYRQAVQIANVTAADAPAGTTIPVTIPHAQLVAQSRAASDGDDIALYLGSTRLESQWDDRARLAQDDLTLIALLPQAIPPGPFTGLALYYGDPAVTVTRGDQVFAFSERFDADVGGDWFTADDRWARRCSNRLMTSPGNSYCIQDSVSGLGRRTLATPRVPSLISPTAPNVIYEFSFWVAGIMEQQGDGLYFSYSRTKDDFAGSTTVPDNLYLSYPPNADISFQETTGRQRAVRGWKLPAAAPGQDWMRAKMRFVPGIDQPSLHLRYISINSGTSNQTLVGVEDYTVRRALEPEFQVTLGPVEVK